MDNPCNQLITKQQVENILNYFQNIGDNNTRLEISNLETFQRAFVHESYYQSVQNAVINSQLQEGNVFLSYIPSESNERLEYLGDHALKAIMGKYLFERFDNEREGFLTRLKIKIEKCSMLHQIGVTLGFKKFLLLSLQVENQTILDHDRGRNTNSYFEDAFEAFVGAIVLEYGEKGIIYADRFVRSVIENIIDFAEIISKNDNWKDSLQRWFQSQKMAPPVYTSLHEDGPLYRKVFTSMLVITKEQMEKLDPKNQDDIANYTKLVISEYKRNNYNIFSKLFSLQEQGSYVLGIGTGRKVVNSQQECAKVCMQNLRLDLNY